MCSPEATGSSFFHPGEEQALLGGAPSSFAPNLITGGQVFGAIGSSVGAYYSTQAQKASLKAQATLDDINAQMSEKQAESALLAGQREENQSQLKKAAMEGTQRATLAANGVDLGSQTAVNILTSTETLGQMDANTIAANAVRQAWGIRTQAVNSANDALMKRAYSKELSPLTVAGTSLLTSASSIGTTRYMMDKGFFNPGQMSF